MKKNQKKSRIDESDKELAMSITMATFKNIRDKFKDFDFHLEGVIRLFESTYPEDEIEAGHPRPAEYSAAIKLQRHILRDINHITEILKKEYDK